MKARRRLRRRILTVLACMTLVVAGVFSLYVFAFTYAVEDALLRAQLEDEARFLRSSWAQPRHPTPRDPRMTLHRSLDSLPAEVSTVLREEPRRSEFPGRDGHHYHLVTLDLGDGAPAWLLYDAIDRLVVRPMRGAMVWVLAVTAFAATLLTLLAGWWATRRLTRRLEVLAERVDRLDPANLASVDWGPQGDDEVGVVARGLESMTRRLRAFVERERGFTRDASHELRTPLTIIRTAGDQLAAQSRLDGDARRHIHLVQESALRLGQILDTLLVLAREEHIAPGQARIDAVPLVEQAVLDQAVRLEGKAVEVKVDIDRPFLLRVPAGVLRIVLDNLIGNAFAHTAQGIVRIDVDGSRLRIRNPWSGGPWIGWPDASVPFRKGEASEGSGLGLAIVDRLSTRFGIDVAIVVDEGEVVASLAARQAVDPGDGVAGVG